MDEDGNEIDAGSSITHRVAYLAEDENKAIKATTFTGEMMQDSLTISMDGREKLLLNADIFKVDNLGTYIKDNNAEGYLGLLPGDTDVSLLQNMVDMKEISNRMFSLFISLDSADSVIKFGGYDKSGVANGSPFHLLTSETDDYWSFALT